VFQITYHHHQSMKSVSNWKYSSTTTGNRDARSKHMNNPLLLLLELQSTNPD